jgi:hypothetical protein
MGRKNKNNIPLRSHDLPKTNLKFSFEFYDIIQNKYCLSKWSEKDISTTLKRLKEVCEKNFQELFKDRSTYHFHSIDWTQTTERGFPNTKIQNLEPFQFALLGVNNQKARVYGAYADNTFFIVWFDLNHEICPSFKKHT